MAVASASRKGQCGWPGAPMHTVGLIAMAVRERTDTTGADPGGPEPSAVGAVHGAPNVSASVPAPQASAPARPARFPRRRRGAHSAPRRSAPAARTGAPRYRAGHARRDSPRCPRCRLSPSAPPRLQYQHHVRHGQTTRAGDHYSPATNGPTSPALPSAQAARVTTNRAAAPSRQGRTLTARQVSQGKAGAFFLVSRFQAPPGSGLYRPGQRACSARRPDPN